MATINKEPYTRMTNMSEVIQNKCYLSEVGWSEDKGYYFRGRYYSELEISTMFNTEFKYKTVTLDGKQIPK